MTIECPKCKTDNPDTASFCNTCATSLRRSDDIPARTETIEAPREELTTGSTFAGRYQIIEELGRGGMGRVYKAHDIKIKEKIALKLIKPEIAKDKKTIERFSNELRLARKIRHKNVCGMFDLGEEKGTHYITMEFVPGEDLRSSIRRFGQLPIAKSISIAKQICGGLSEAHKLGVVHRDMKSSNIMIDKDGNVRIMDFGIARSLEAKGITGAGVMIGTPEYMSPEQVEGKEVDRRSDIYSLGVILYEMTTGRVPFEGDTPFTIGMKHKSEMPQNPKELNSQISDGLNRLILKCLEKEKDKRYQSAGEVRSELSNIEKGLPTTERIIPERKPLTSREITVTLGLKKLLVPASLLIAAVIIAVFIWRPWAKQTSVPIPAGKPSLAVMYFENNTGDEKLEHWRKAIAELLITDLSQSKYIRVLSRDSLYNILAQTNLLEAKSYSSEDIKEVADRSGVNHILQGGFVKAGDTFRINYSLQDVSSGELVEAESMEGKGQESIFSMVDEMTKKIKQGFKLSEAEISSDMDKAIGTITTNSPEAYKFYTEGYRFITMQDPQTGIQFLEKALALDPEFASAYRGLGVAYYNLGFYAEARENFKKAMELSNRVSERERYKNEAEFYYWNESTYDKALEAYTKLLDLYPDDTGGNNNLALLYQEIEEWDKALERWEYLREMNLAEALEYGNLANQYRLMGMHEKAKAIIEEYLSKLPDNWAMHGWYALIHLDLGDYDLALAEVEKAFSLNPTSYRVARTKGDIFLCMGDPIRAEKEYKTLQSRSDPLSHGWGLYRLAELCFVRGQFEEFNDYMVRFIDHIQKLDQKVVRALNNAEFGFRLQKIHKSEEALKKLDDVLEFAVETGDWRLERSALSHKGLAYIKMKSFDKAHMAAERLKELCVKSPNKKIIRMYDHLLGMIELEQGNHQRAIESLEKAVSLDPHFFKSYLGSLGLAYLKAGNLEKAKVEYEKIITCPRGIRQYDIDFVKAFYMLGKIHEEQGNTARAIEQYEKFLDLWKDADPDIPEVEDARERLAGLKGQ